MSEYVENKTSIQLKLLDEKDYLARLEARNDFIQAWRRMKKWDGDPPYYPKLVRRGHCPFMEVGTIVYLIDLFDPRSLVNPDHPLYNLHSLRFNAGRRQVTSRNMLDRLSSTYWMQWSMIRPPIGVIGPNGYIWEIDSWTMDYRKGGLQTRSWMVSGYPEDANLTVEGSLLTDTHMLRVEEGVLHYKERKVKR